MKYVLAPLAGFTDAPFRRMCHEGGADIAYAEMVSAAGLAHGSSPTRHLLETMPGEGPVACQIFGANESDIAYATDFIQRNYVEAPLPSSLFPLPSLRFSSTNLVSRLPSKVLGSRSSTARVA